MARPDGGRFCRILPRAAPDTDLRPAPSPPGASVRGGSMDGGFHSRTFRCGDPSALFSSQSAGNREVSVEHPSESSVERWQAILFRPHPEAGISAFSRPIRDSRPCGITFATFGKARQIQSKKCLTSQCNTHSILHEQIIRAGETGRPALPLLDRIGHRWRVGRFLAGMPGVVFDVILACGVYAPLSSGLAALPPSFCAQALGFSLPLGKRCPAESRAAGGTSLCSRAFPLPAGHHDAHGAGAAFHDLRSS